MYGILSCDQASYGSRPLLSPPCYLSVCNRIIIIARQDSLKCANPSPIVRPRGSSEKNDTSNRLDAISMRNLLTLSEKDGKSFEVSKSKGTLHETPRVNSLRCLRMFDCPPYRIIASDLKLSMKNSAGSQIGSQCSYESEKCKRFRLLPTQDRYQSRVIGGLQTKVHSLSIFLKGKTISRHVLLRLFLAIGNERA